MKEHITQALAFRSAIKVFDSHKEVPADLLEAILESGRMAPSSYGLQPFRIINVKDLDTKNKIKEAAYGQAQVVEASHLFVLAVATHIDEAYIDAYIAHISRTRDVSLESLSEYKGMMMGAIVGRSQDEKVSWASKQAYIALGFMLETAALVEVDAGPMEGFVSNKVDEILSLSTSHLTSICLLVIGYRGDDRYSKMKKVRVPKEQFIIG